MEESQSTVLRTDEDGFLTSAEGWSRGLAAYLAQLNQLGPLTEEHYRIIEFVRGYYLQTGEGPPIVKIAKATGLSSKQICSLFPCGIVRGAYRLAGLPRPPGCF